MYYELLPIENVKFDKDNPRIKQWIEMYGNNVTNQEITLALQADNTSSSYTALKESIKNNQGIINPIIVNKQKDGKYIVIEGNTRLQIYKEFNQKDPDGPWSKIICIIYENMDKEKIDAIRLQAHLVGAREWDPYSKAKYLYHLSKIEKMPLPYIESYCGNKKSEIRIYIDAYEDMITSYKKICESKGMDIDPKVFSKFSELQKSNVKQSIYNHKYTIDDFSKWVIYGNIDSAQNVRLLPKILKNDDALSEFLKTNISEAKKYLDISANFNRIFENISIYDLIKYLINKIRIIEFSEVIKLRDDPRYEENKEIIIELESELQNLLQEIGFENE